MHRLAAYVVLIIAFVAGTSAFVHGFPDGEREDAARVKSVEGKTFYTRANIFYEKPLKIYSTNYLKGKIFPAGSKVTVTFAGGNEIEFKDEKGVTYILILKRKHASETMTLGAYFDQYFSPENPLGEGGPYSKCTETEQWNIRNGMVETGMSREAVLMAYGYPPSHATPDLKSDKWTYWTRKLHGAPIHVYFRNDRVYRIVNGKRVSPD